MGKPLNSSQNPGGGRRVPESRELGCGGPFSLGALCAFVFWGSQAAPPPPGVSSTQMTSIYPGHQGLLLASFVTVLSANPGIYLHPARPQATNSTLDLSQEAKKR